MYSWMIRRASSECDSLGGGSSLPKRGSSDRFMSQRWVQNQKGTIELDQKGEHDLNEASSTAGRMGVNPQGSQPRQALNGGNFALGIPFGRLLRSCAT